MNWLQIDEILWEVISSWNGKDKEKLLETISKKFNWSIRQAETACDYHFNMRDRLKK